MRKSFESHTHSHDGQSFGAKEISRESPVPAWNGFNYHANKLMQITTRLWILWKCVRLHYRKWIFLGNNTTAGLFLISHFSPDTMMHLVHAAEFENGNIKREFSHSNESSRSEQNSRSMSLNCLFLRSFSLRMVQFVRRKIEASRCG